MLTAYLFVVIPKGFIPTEDNGTIFAFTEAAQDISFEAMMAHQRAVADVVRQQPYVEQFMSFIGASGSSTVDEQRPDLHPAEAARRSGRPSTQVIADLRPKLAAVPGIRVYLQVLPTIRIGGQLTKARLPVHAAGRRPPGALPLGAAPLRAAARSCPGCRT